VSVLYEREVQMKASGRCVVNAGRVDCVCNTPFGQTTCLCSIVPQTHTHIHRTDRQGREWLSPHNTTMHENDTNSHRFTCTCMCISLGRRPLLLV
jgi:hypothetical protein